MLAILSPAKTLDFDSVNNCTEFTQPIFEKESKELIKVLKRLKSPEIADLMSVSEKIADLNVGRFKAFKIPFSLENAKQAILAFKGDVYIGLEAEKFSQEDFDFAQEQLRILSGLYGVLRPLDLMQAYRLEMKTSLANKKGNNLYAFWGNKIAKELNKSMPLGGDQCFVNLASNEYWSAVDTKSLAFPVLTIQFKEKRGDEYKVISFNAKKARGRMARFMVQHRLNKIADLKKFEGDNYRYNGALSSEWEWIFTC